MLEGSCLCGSVTWTYDKPLESATACNCTACRRYGTLWAYGYQGQGIQVTGDTTHYHRNRDRHSLGFYFCGKCGCVTHWLATREQDEKGNLRMAVNLRLSNDPEKIQHLKIDHFDGFGTFEDLPSDGKTIKDMWF